MYKVHREFMRKRLYFLSYINLIDDFKSQSIMDQKNFNIINTTQILKYHIYI